jgi:RimJ/RimL family protein N-acetyltransferase
VTEAVVAMTRFAIDVLKVARVEIRCAEKNLPSRRVAERAGFQLEGTLRHHARECGQLRDTAVYSVIAG